MPAKRERSASWVNAEQTAEGGRPPASTEVSGAPGNGLAMVDCFVPPIMNEDENPFVIGSARLNLYDYVAEGFKALW